MSKTNEELNKLKEELMNVNKKLHELTPEELEQVTGGVTDPLYKKYGAHMSDDLRTINPADISSIEVLKDATATAVYGTKGAN